MKVLWGVIFATVGLLWQTSAWAVAPNNFFRKHMQTFFLDEIIIPPFEARFDYGKLREELEEKLGLSGKKSLRLPLRLHYYGKSEAGEPCHVHISANLEEVKVSILNRYSELALEFTLYMEDAKAGQTDSGLRLYGTEGRGMIRWEENSSGRRMTWVEGRFPEYIKIDQLEMANGQRFALNLYCGKLKTNRSIYDRFLPKEKPPRKFGGGNDPLGTVTR